jgi:hypothetical protein
MGSTTENFPPIDDDTAIERFSEANPQWQVEIDSAGAYRLSPTHPEGSAMDFEAGYQLKRFAERHGGKVFGSTAGFRLADGSRAVEPAAQDRMLARVPISSSRSRRNPTGGPI